SEVDHWEWDPAATQFVENLINNNPRATFTPVLEKENSNVTLGDLFLIITAERWQLLPDFARELISLPLDGTEENIDVGRLLIMSRFAAPDSDAVLEEVIKLEEKDQADEKIVPRTSEPIHPNVQPTKRSRGRGRGLLSISGGLSPGHTPSLSSVIDANGLLNGISPIRSIDNRSVASLKIDFDSVGLSIGSQNFSSDMEEIPGPKTHDITRLLKRQENMKVNIHLDSNSCNLSVKHCANKSPKGSRKPKSLSESAPRKSDNIEETKIISLISSGVSPHSASSSRSSLSPPNVSVRYERERLVKSCGSMDRSRRKSSNSYLTINNQTFDLDSSSEDSDNAFEESPKRRILRAKRSFIKTSKNNKLIKNENERSSQSKEKDFKKATCLKTSEVTLSISDLENKIGKLLSKENHINESSTDERELKGPSHNNKIPDSLVQNDGDFCGDKYSPFAGLTSSEKTPAIEGVHLVPDVRISCTKKPEASDEGVDKLAEFIKRIELSNGYAFPFKQSNMTENVNHSQKLIELGENQDLGRLKEVNILDEVSISESEIDNLIASLSSNTCNIDVTSWVSSHFTNRNERERKIDNKNNDYRSDKTSYNIPVELLENCINKVDKEKNEMYRGIEYSSKDPFIESNIERHFTGSCKSSKGPTTTSGVPTALEKTSLTATNTPKTYHQTHSFALDTRDEWTRQPNLEINASEFIYIENKNYFPEGLNISRLFRVFVAGETQIPDEDVIITKDNMTALLNDHVVNVLENMGTKATCLQGYMWPLLCKGSSAVAVGAQRSGKTMGYIVPLLSILLDTWQYVNERLVPGIGAVMVILCSGWRNVQHIGQTIHAFLPAKSNLKVVTSWGGCNEQETAESKLELLNGCDILITTAPHLSRLLAEEPAQGGTPGTSLVRCCHLVIDDAQHILEYFAGDVKQILKSWGDGGIKKSRGDLPQQIVVVGLSWQKRLQDLTLTLAPILDLTMVISAPAEAAKASKVKTIVHYVKQNVDVHALVIDLIRNTYASKRSLIFTSSNAESRVLRKLLESVAIKCICITEKKMMWEIQEIVRRWHASKSKTMLVSEGAVQELLMQDICNADVIIHIHIPEPWMTFLQKYSFMIDNFKFDFESGKSECVSHVILQPSTVESKPFVIEELTKLGADIPSDICSSDSVYQENYEPIPLCHFLKAYGECKMGLNCDWRHKVNVEDVPKEIPRSGDVVVKVVKVLNASRYLVHIIEWRHGNTKINLANNYLNLFLALQQHYSDTLNRVCVRQMESGQLCGVLHDCIWSRARIIRVNYSLRVPLVLLFLIDEGLEITLESKDVFELPLLMCILPQLIVEVYLCCIRPFDMDNEWTPQASIHMHETFASCQNDTKFAGKIVLALGPRLWTPTLWLSPLVELVQIGTKMVKKDSIRSRLLAQRFGVDNPKHLVLLKEQCKKCGISLDEGYLTEQCWKENYNNFEQLSSDLNQQCNTSDSLSNNQEATCESSCYQSMSQADVRPSLPYDIKNNDHQSNNVIKCLEVNNITDSVKHYSNVSQQYENTVNMNMPNLHLSVKSSTNSSFSSAKYEINTLSDLINNCCSSTKNKMFSKDSSNTCSFATAKNKCELQGCSAIMTSQEELPLLKEVQVEVGEVESPEWFFIKREDKFECLDNLEDTINNNKDWLIYEYKYENYITKSVPVYHHCIAKFTDGKYYRGWVDRDDGSNQRVFFIDHGETVYISENEVHPCPEKYLTALPAQAIPCSLAHVMVPKSLQEKAAAAMERIVDASDTWVVNALKEKKNDDGNIYEVELVDTSKTPPTQLWRQLLSEGVVIETLDEAREMNLVPLIPSCLDTPETGDFCIPGDEASRFLFSLPGMKEQFEKLMQQESGSYVDVDNVNDSSNSGNSAPETHIENKGVQTDIKSQKIKEIDTFKDLSRNVCQNGKGYKGEKMGKKNKTFIYKNDICTEMSGIDRNIYPEKNFNGNTNDPHLPDKNNTRKKFTKKKNNQKKNIGNKRNGEKERNYFQKNCLAVPSLEAVEGVTERFSPITRWWQDQHMVYMKLSVAASTGYKCRLTQNNLTFMTIINERWFVMDEVLFGEIDPDCSFVKPEGTSISIILRKKKGETWSRLTIRDNALPWLTSQCNVVTDEGSESDVAHEQLLEQVAEEVGKGHGKIGGLPAGISDTSDGSCFYSSDSSVTKDMFS
ncbi:unnamed protein product, partial [Meganyctiphanes norvegica]